MATKEAVSLATRYVKDQLRIMEKYGDKPTVSKKRFDATVNKVARTFDSIAPAK